MRLTDRRRAEKNEVRGRVMEEVLTEGVEKDDMNGDTQGMGWARGKEHERKRDMRVRERDIRCGNCDVYAFPSGPQSRQGQ
eukprot:2437889-Pyramimonas_sp.AAC.1